MFALPPHRESETPEGLPTPAVGEALAWSRRDWVMLAVVLATTLLLRGALAWQLQYIPSDGAFYFSVAQRMEQGATPYERDPLNVYPLILSHLHRLGLDWFTAAKVWGVVAATLVVFPLFGWVRREFNTAIAHWTCLLYAVHPKLIEYAPEPLRESTFWLALVACLYLARCALRAGSPTLFALAGLSWAAAAYTRFEGWFLAVPLTIWAAHAYVRRPGDRRAIVVGSVVGLAMFPAFVIAMNAAAPQHGWRLGNVSQLGLVLKWFNLVATEPPVHDVPKGTPHQTLTATLRASAETAPATRHNLTNGAFVFLASKAVKGIGPACGLLMLIGFGVAWRKLIGIDQLALVPVALLTLVGMTLMLWYCGDTSSRYVLTATLLAMPYAACGAQAVVGWVAVIVDVLSSRVSMLSAALTPPSRRVTLATSLVLVVLIGAGVKGAIAPPYEDRRLWAELGRRLGETLDEGDSVVSCGPRQVGYYSGASSLDVPPSSLAVEVARRRPQAVVVNRSALSTTEWANFEATRLAGGWPPAAFEVAHGGDDVKVYVRPCDDQQSQRESAPATGRRF